MTDIQIEDNYNRFINLIKDNIKRGGVDNLIKWLNSKNAKDAPASTRYHLSCRGGLIKHCLNVYERLNQFIELEYKDTECPYTKETLTIVSLLHDISKVDFYEIQERNTKDENGNWIKVPYYSVKDEDHRFIYGSHSMNSVYMLSKFINLTHEESLAILHHMGGMDTTEDKFTVKNISEAYKKSALALLLFFADMSATFRDEGINE